MTYKVTWDLDSLDGFIISFASSTVIENNKNAITCGNIVKGMVNDIMLMDHTTTNKTDLEVLQQTKNNKELFSKFERLYEKIKGA